MFFIRSILLKVLKTGISGCLEFFLRIKLILCRIQIISIVWIKCMGIIQRHDLTILRIHHEHGYILSVLFLQFCLYLFLNNLLHICINTCHKVIAVSCRLNRIGHAVILIQIRVFPSVHTI